VPADVVLLHVPDGSGLAYIDTMALDGETNRKSRSELLSTDQWNVLLSDENDFRLHLTVDQPNADLIRFRGRFRVNDGNVGDIKTSNVIYRGSMLRTTSEALGLVVYTGEECKIRLNKATTPCIKTPRLQALVNRTVVFMTFIVIVLTVANTAAGVIWQHNARETAFYLAGSQVGAADLLASFFLMFNPMIPLALYISLEIVKIAQTAQMNDVDMFDETSGIPLEVRTSAIHEDLGQVR
jgi:phospholipid-translocating ATPase